MAKREPSTPKPIPEQWVAQNQMLQQHAMVAYAKRLGLLPQKPAPHLIDPLHPTDNYKAQAASLGWVWHLAALGKDHPDTAARRERLLAEMLRQRSEWMGSEQCAPDPHFGMHAAAFAVALLFATIHNDVQLLGELRWWWNACFAVAKACNTPSGEVIVACCNSRDNMPGQGLWSRIWRTRLGRAHPQEAILRERPSSTALWALVDERVNMRAISIAETLPTMRCPLTVTRTATGYIASIERPTGKRVEEKWVCSRVEVAGNELVKAVNGF